MFLQHTSDGSSFEIEVAASPLRTLQRTTKSAALSSKCIDDELALDNATLSADVCWEWNSLLPSRTSLTRGLFEDGIYCGNIAALWTEPHAVSPFEIEFFQTVSAIVHAPYSLDPPRGTRR